jgi:hypothetical protein
MQFIYVPAAAIESNAHDVFYSIFIFLVAGWGWDPADCHPKNKLKTGPSARLEKASSLPTQSVFSALRYPKYRTPNLRPM